jgi:DNA-binding NarL/FixJ family response regulator
MVSVLTVDDQEVFRRAARSLIAAAPDFEQVGEAANGPDAIALAADLHPDLALVDVRMPGMDGIETARRLTEVDPAIRVVLISLDEVPELAGVELPMHIRKQDLSIRTLRQLWDAP